MTQVETRRAGGLVRDTAAITGLNLLSRVTGFARVIAMAAALGATALGDTYQAANLVSNILFELLAGGLLAAILVPVFVERITADDREGALAVARTLLGRSLVALSVVVGVLVLAAEPLMRVLTIGSTGDRDLRVELGSYLLVFFLPQILLYAAGAVATALLQAERRFVAAAAAPVANNLVVIATMLVFRHLRDGRTDLPLASREQLVLAVGTTAGVAAMTAVPWLAIGGGRRAWPRLVGSPIPLRPLLSKGLWAAGHLGFNQVLVAVTIVLAARVDGGVVAYQVAFTFFLLPHALLANPVYTALFPRFSEHVHHDRPDELAADVSRGLRLTALLVVPAAGLLAALAGPTLDLVRLGNLDAAGADLVAVVLAAYAVGLLGYSAFFLLTRAAYALDDARSPTVANAYATVAAVPAMIVASGLVDGDARVAVLGLVHAVAVTAASTGLWLVVQRRIGRAVPCLASAGRAVVLAAIAGAAAHLVAGAVDGPARLDALAALSAGGLVGVVLYAAGQWVWGGDDLRTLRGVRP